MRTILIPVINKIAQSPAEEIVCGNSDYFVEFAFDSDWDDQPKKTARFIYSGKCEEREFEGNTVQVPVMKNTTKVLVGVYAGELETTTPAVVKCRRSILCIGAKPAPTKENNADTRNDTVTPETLFKGVTAHNAAGVQITGTFTVDEIDALIGSGVLE